MADQLQPIETANRFEDTLAYIAQKSLELGSLVLEERVTIDTITFFTQSPQEYKFVEAAIRKYGPVSKVSHGQTLYIDTSFRVLDNDIKYLGVRHPDPTRPERGYADFPVREFQKYVELSNTHPNLQCIQSGRGQALIEVRHPDFDVRGYIVNANDH